MHPVRAFKIFSDILHEAPVLKLLISENVSKDSNSNIIHSQKCNCACKKNNSENVL